MLTTKPFEDRTYWEIRDWIGKPHWFAACSMFQDDGFGTLELAPSNTAEAVGRWVAEAAGEVTGHA